MPNVDYDRYELYRNEDGTVNQPPFVYITKAPSDKYEKWKPNSRLDKIAQRFYDNVFFDFLILYANPEYLSEFDIPEGTVIRIPFPLDRARAVYEEGLDKIRNR